MGWILFFSGLFLGGILGVFAICRRRGGRKPA